MQTRLFDNDDHVIDATAFWSKVDWDEINDLTDAFLKCWIWQAGTDRDGHGMHNACGKQYRAHRLAYFLRYKEWPPVVMHLKCDTPACVNPFHLAGGTQRLNILDRDSKGNQAKGESNGRSKLVSGQVREVRRRYEEEDTTYRKLARDYPVGHSVIGDIVREKTWRHLL